MLNVTLLSMLFVYHSIFIQCIFFFNGMAFIFYHDEIVDTACCEDFVVWLSVV